MKNFTFFPFNFIIANMYEGGGVVRFPTEEYKTELRKKEKTYLNVVKISSLAFENAFVLSRGIRVLGFSTKISLSLSLSLSLAYIIYFYLQTTRGLAPYFSFPREVGRGEETRSFFSYLIFFSFCSARLFLLCRNIGGGGGKPEFLGLSILTNKKKGGQSLGGKKGRMKRGNL
jgi:hypothetical protein